MIIGIKMATADYTAPSRLSESEFLALNARAALGSSEKKADREAGTGFLDGRVAKMAALSGAQEKKPTKPDNKAVVVTNLPLWSCAVRGIPNGVLRSALFGIVRRGQRKYLEAEQLANIDGLSVLFTGPRLDQADLDVWEQCLHLSRTSHLGGNIEFTGHGFLKSIRRDTGKSQHEWLKGALRRLMSGVVEIQDGKKAYAGQLIHHWARDEDTKAHIIVINPAILKLYGKDGWTSIQWDQRLALKGLPLAQWLHGFYSTHAKAYPYKVRTLHALCKSDTTELFNFRRDLREALGHIEAKTSWSWSIEDDLVTVDTTPTASQKRSLIRKKPRKIGTA
jgi:hypothetical protein